MKANGDYFVTVIVDKRYNKLIGSATLVLERKFIHGCAIVSDFIVFLHLKVISTVV